MWALILCWASHSYFSLLCLILIDVKSSLMFLLALLLEQKEEVSIIDATLLWFIDCRFWKLRKLIQDRKRHCHLLRHEVCCYGSGGLGSWSCRATSLTGGDHLWYLRKERIICGWREWYWTMVTSGMRGSRGTNVERLRRKSRWSIRYVFL